MKRIFCAVMATLWAVCAAGPRLDGAAKLMADGNFAEAYVAYTNVIFAVEGEETPTDGDRAQALLDAARCVRKVSRLSEVEPLLEKARAERGEFPVRLACVQALGELPHTGSMVKGRFVRGEGWRGDYSSMERDRVVRLRWLEELMPAVAAQTRLRQRWFWNETVDALMMNGRDAECAWKLVDLTDLGAVPEVVRRGRWRWALHDFESAPAPVDGEGRPVFHAMPESWSAARTDGERWRAANAARSAVDETGRMRSAAALASFAARQFGVQTLRGEQNAAVLVDDLVSLADDETIARVANGVQRFKLPEDYCYIRLWELGANTAAIANEFEMRYQFARAAAIYGKAGRNDDAKRITAPGVRFEGSVPATSWKRRGTFTITHRNAAEILFSLQRIDAEKRLSEVRDFVKSGVVTNDWRATEWLRESYMQGERPEALAKYLAGEKMEWRVAVKQAAGHFDTRTEVAVPFDLEPGDYMLRAEAPGGGCVHSVLRVERLAVVKETVARNGWTGYRVVDAETGAPMAGVKLDAFMWSGDYYGGRPRGFKWKEYPAVTDEAGFAVLRGGSHDDAYYSGFVVCRAPDGSTAVVSTDHHGVPGLVNPGWLRRGVIITDRPAYRPGDTIKYKMWARRREGHKEPLPKKGVCRLYMSGDGSGEPLMSEELTFDSFGGASGEFRLPADAKLGEYRLWYEGFEISTAVRVEEYRKPEFEVAVDAPKGALALGEKITATVRAKYYFGEPVKRGRANVTVRRSPRRAVWHPVCEWDWLYGGGCCWYFYDSDWYAGPGRLSLSRVSPWQGYAPPGPAPETVATMTDVPLDENGEVKVVWDTSFARKLYGDVDQEYSIVASVMDESRRTIDGSGSVVARAEPFRVFAWTDRPRYRVGDTIEANSHVDGLDEDEIASRKWRLYELSASGEEPAGEGTGPRFSASKPGQYRISCEVTDVKGRTREGSRIITVFGAGDDGRAFRYAALELVPDKAFYAPGEKVRLAIDTDYPGSTVFLKTRGGETQVVRMAPGAKTAEIEVDVTEGDKPNFYIEAWTVTADRCHTETREVMVPPADKIGQAAVEVEGGKDGVFKPGERVAATVRIFDHEGAPADASAVMTVYDKAIDAIAGGSNVKDLKTAFWSARRIWRTCFNGFEVGRESRWLRLNGDVMCYPLGLFGINGVVGFSLGEGVKLQGSVKTLPRAEEPRAAGAMARVAKMRMAANDEIEEEKSLSAGELEADGGGSRGVRSDFADTAYWNATLESTGTQGVYRVEFDMPDDTTGWNIKVWSMGEGGRVAEAAIGIATKKELMLRMQTPRFLTEGDEVTISANVHNYSEAERRVAAVLSVEPGPLEVVTPSRQGFELAPGGETRVDWRVRAVRPGRAKLVMRAADGELADGVERELEVQAHTVEKTLSHFKLLRGGSTFPRGVFEGEAGLRLYRGWNFPVPEGASTNGMSAVVEVYDTFAEAIDRALPYLKFYEYECNEQTMNRFVPAAAARRLLVSRGLGDNLLDIDILIAKGLKKLGERQNSDGGWGWFYGSLEHSSEHMTATVVRGLAVVKAAGADVPAHMLKRGREWLAARQRESLDRLRSNKNARPHALDVLTAHAMLSADAKGENDALDEMLARAYEARLELPVYAQALLGLSLDLRGDLERRDMVVRNLKQHLQEDAENGTAWLELANAGCWWRWYGSDIEAQATALMLFLRVEPRGEAARGLALYLANNRKARTHWTSTRDTGLAVEALARYCEAVEGADGPVYVNAYLTCMTREEPVKAAGLELKVERAISRVDGGRLVPLADGAEARVGDVLEIRLDIDSKNDYEYVLVEDMKGAGFEPVETESGYRWMNGECAYVEFRERKTALFLREVPRGARSLSYRVRVESPGRVHVLPATVRAMYAPRLKGNSGEVRLGVADIQAAGTGAAH